jgi:hypothetical protein
MKPTPPLAVLSSLFVLVLAFTARAQSPREQFAVDFNKAVELADDKLMDRAVKGGAKHAVAYYETLWFEVIKQAEGAKKKADALKAAWVRCFGNSETIDRMQGWADAATSQVYGQINTIRGNASRLWSDYTNNVQKSEHKDDFRRLADQYAQLARNAEQLGHYLEAGDLWQLGSVVASKIPDKNADDRDYALNFVVSSVDNYDRWGFKFDDDYTRAVLFIKGEREALAEARKAEEERKAAGYDPNAKGIEALVMAGVAPTKADLKFAALPNWSELDYGPKGGPVPPFWWIASLGEDPATKKVDWFTRGGLQVHRIGVTKFTAGGDGVSPEDATPIDVSPKGKVSSFFLDADKKVPYAMVFWVGSDRELVNECECNLSPSKTLANVYYRSASSWKATFGKDEVTFYDDNASGWPADANPYEKELKSMMLGTHDDGGTVVPLMDSMRVGKGPRVPFSQFVKLSTGWHFLKKEDGDQVAVQPLNPEYFKTGKIKLDWEGPKTAAPVQLVVRGKGDYETAWFELAGGKEVEVPAGEYTVAWGKVVQGKGARIQTANLYPSADHKPILVEAGKVATLQMGAPFQLRFVRGGSGDDVQIDALKIHVVDRAGCLFTEYHGSALACEVLAAKDESGKGAKPVAEFVRFTNSDLVGAKAAHHYNQIGLMVACFPMPEDYKEGPLVLSVKLPGEGMKVGLAIKKHALFGPLASPFQ